MSDASAMSDAEPVTAPGQRSALPPFVAAAAADVAADLAADLPRRAADAVQQVVDVVHDKAVRPATLVARAVVFGLVVAALGTLLLVLGSIAVLRLLDVYAFGHRVWLSYIVIGGAISLCGLALWSRRTARTRPGA